MKLLDKVIEEVQIFEHKYTEEIDDETKLREDLGFTDTQVQELIENIEFTCDVSLPLSEYPLDKQGTTLQDIVDAVLKEK